MGELQEWSEGLLSISTACEQLFRIDGEKVKGPQDSVRIG